MPARKPASGYEPDAATLHRLHAICFRDPRVILKAFRGEAVNAMTFASVTAAAQQLGIPQPPPFRSRVAVSSIKYSQKPSA